MLSVFLQVVSNLWADVARIQTPLGILSVALAKVGECGFGRGGCIHELNPFHAKNDVFLHPAQFTLMLPAGLVSTQTGRTRRFHYTA